MENTITLTDIFQSDFCEREPLNQRLSFFYTRRSIRKRYSKPNLKDAMIDKNIRTAILVYTVNVYLPEDQIQEIKKFSGTPDNKYHIAILSVCWPAPDFKAMNRYNGSLIHFGNY